MQLKNADKSFEPSENIQSNVDRRQSGEDFYKREICKLASIPGKVISSSDQAAEVSSNVQPGLCLHAKHKIAEPTRERIWGM